MRSVASPSRPWPPPVTRRAGLLGRLGCLRPRGLSSPVSRAEEAEPPKGLDLCCQPGKVTWRRPYARGAPVASRKRGQLVCGLWLESAGRVVSVPGRPAVGCDLAGSFPRAVPGTILPASPSSSSAPPQGVFVSSRGWAGAPQEFIQAWPNVPGPAGAAPLTTGCGNEHRVQGPELCTWPPQPLTSMTRHTAP